MQVAKVYDIGKSFEERPMKVMGIHLDGKGAKGWKNVFIEGGSYLQLYKILCWYKVRGRSL